MDLERESPPAQWNQEKICNLSSWSRMAFVCCCWWFCLCVCFASPSVFLSCPVFFNILSFFSKNIYYCWNLVVRYEKWEWSLCRRYVFKRRRFAVLSTTLTSPSLRIQCDFCDKEHRGNLMYPTRCLSRSLSQSTHSGSTESRRLFLFLLELVSLSLLLLAFWGLSLYFW